MSKIYAFNNSLVQAGNNLLAGEPGSAEYIAGPYISIEDDVISVTGLQPEGDYATEVELQTVSAAIPDVSNLASKSEVQAVSAAIPEYPEVTELIAGSGVNIAASGEAFVISAECVIPIQVVASSAAASGTNILYIVTG